MAVRDAVGSEPSPPEASAPAERKGPSVPASTAMNTQARYQAHHLRPLAPLRARLRQSSRAVAALAQLATLATLALCACGEALEPEPGNLGSTDELIGVLGQGVFMSRDGLLTTLGEVRFRREE
jgi:hypothetical protein